MLNNEEKDILKKYVNSMGEMIVCKTIKTVNEIINSTIHEMDSKGVRITESNQIKKMLIDSIKEQLPNKLNELK